MSREQLFAAFFFAVFLFLLYQFYLFVAAFFAPLVWAAILALTFYPVNVWVEQNLRIRRSLSAFLLVFVVTLVAILPSFYLGSLLVNQAAGAYGRLQDAVAAGGAQELLAQVRASRIGGVWTRVEPWLEQFAIDIPKLMLGATSWLSEQIVGRATDLARNVLLSVVNFLIMLVALFFFFRDGEAMANRLRDLLPMEPEHKETIFARLYDTLTAVVQSMVVVAVTQGVLAGLGYWLIGGLTFSLFLGFATALASFVPIAGAALVWVGSSIYLLLIGETGRAIGLAVWGVLGVSMADNWIKPIFIGGRAKLPTALLLIALLGGLQVYGFLGVFLGPVILAILMTFVEIYRDLYGDRRIVHSTDLSDVPPPPRERVA